MAATAVPPGRGRLLAVPAMLVLVEAARGRWPFGGLPLAGPALGQASGPLAPAAAVVGALGLVALTATAGVALTTVGTRRNALAAIGVLAGVAAMVGIGGGDPAGRPTGALTVAAVQGGGPRGVPRIRADFDAVFARQLAASQQLRPPLDLILWPEGVVDLDGPIVGSRADATLGELARRLEATVVAGVTESVGADRFRNAAVAWNPQGRPVARYDKVHRVPFGEYAPGRRLLARVADLSLLPRDAIPGRGPGLLATPAGDLGVLISYEVFFADRARAALQAGGEVLVVPTTASSYTSGQIRPRSSRRRGCGPSRPDEQSFRRRPDGLQRPRGPDREAGGPERAGRTGCHPGNRSAAIGHDRLHPCRGRADGRPHAAHPHRRLAGRAPACCPMRTA